MKDVKVEYVKLDDEKTIEELEKERENLMKELFKREPDKEIDKELVLKINSINKILTEKKEIKQYGRILTEEEREKEFEKQYEQVEKYLEEQERMDELIEKHDQRVSEMQKAYDDFINAEKEMEEYEERIFPRKQITVKLFPNTHKKIKVIATSKDTTLEKVATSIVEDKIYNMDIAKYVADEFKSADELSSEWGFDDYETAQYGYEKMQDSDKSLYDKINKELKSGNPRKRINVKVYYETHRKLRVMAAIQDRSLDNIVSEIIEDEIGEVNEFDTGDLLDQLLEERLNEK